MKLHSGMRQGLFIPLACALALVSLTALPTNAYAVTSAEKQAEADAIMREIDVLQTSLNEATEEYNRAIAESNEARQLADEAGERVKLENQKLSVLQGSLASSAVNMYKNGGSMSFIDVILGATTFEEFLTSWDALTLISDQGANLVSQTKAVRDAQQQAQQSFDEQSQKAGEQARIAEESMKRIEDTQEALRDEAAKITVEVALLQAQEELEAEAARQAAEAQANAEALAQAYLAAFRSSRAGSATPGADKVTDGGYFSHPLPTGTVSSGFGYRSFNGGSYHMGLDLAAPEGTPYYAGDDGTVIYATYDGGYNGGAGNWIVIAHGNGIVTKYMHSSRVYVKVGERVKRGQNIGTVGNTGDSYGAHLHFQVEINGVAVNPVNFL